MTFFSYGPARFFQSGGFVATSRFIRNVLAQSTNLKINTEVIVVKAMASIMAILAVHLIFGTGKKLLSF